MSFPGEGKRERERQEARAQRELNTRRVNTEIPSPQKKQAMFTIVPNANIDERVKAVLGDFSPNTFVTVEQTPPTPAPLESAHIHDPDTYSPPPPLHPPPLGKNLGAASSSSQYSSSNRSSHHQGPNVLNKVKPPPSGGSFQKNASLHNQFMDDMKRSHKSGPGPGPKGGGGQPSPNMESSQFPQNPSIGGRAHLNERVGKDPDILKIMSEIDDLKAPVSALLKTPRPDHQSMFNFPSVPPAMPPGQVNGFRVPMDPTKGKSGEKPKLHKASPFNASKDLHISSEDSEEETVGSTPLASDSCTSGSTAGNSSYHHISSRIQANTSSNGISTDHKTTDESSNSEDSSGSDSEESSSSEEEEKISSPPPASPTHSDANHWNLANIFQPIRKAESPKSHEQVSSKSYLENSKDIESDHILDQIDEPAPPVKITTSGLSRHKKRSEERLKVKNIPVNIPSQHDESSDEEFSRPTPKAQRTAGERVNHMNGERSLATHYAQNKRTSSKSRLTENDDATLTWESAKESRRSDYVPKVIDKSQSPIKEDLVVVSYPKSSPNKKNSKHNEKQLRSQAVKSKGVIPVDLNSDSDVDVANITTVKRKRVKNNRPERKPSESPMPNQKSPRNLPGPSPDRRSQRTKHAVAEASVKLTPEKQQKDLETKLEQDSRLSSKPIKSESYKKPDKVEKRKKSHRQNNDYSNEVKKENAWPEFDGTSPINRLQVPPSNTPDASLPVNKKRHSTKVSHSEPCSPYTDGSSDVSKLICSIPLVLIDNLPNNRKSVISAASEARLNKEVLEMRTRPDNSGKGKKRERVSNSPPDSKSPPNEDGNKLRAIFSIYKKRPSTTEPTKAKQKIKSEPDSEFKSSPSNQKSDQDTHLTFKKEIKSEIKSEIKIESPKKEQVEEYKTHTSSSPAKFSESKNSSQHKKRKKERKKERSASRENVKEKDAITTPEKISCGRRKRCDSPNSIDKSRKTIKENEGHNSRKKMKMLHKEATPTTSSPHLLIPQIEDQPRPLSSMSGEHISQRPSSSMSGEHISQRPLSSMSGEHISQRPLSSMSGEHNSLHHQSYLESNSSSKNVHQSSQFSTATKNIAASPSSDHDSEVELTAIGEQPSNDLQRFCSTGKPLVEDLGSSQVTNGEISEYHSLTSSEHESRVSYRNGDDDRHPSGGLPSPHSDILPPQPHMEIYQPASTSAMEYSHPLTDDKAPVIYRYISYFERRKVPDKAKDHVVYMERAKELKHKADEKSHQRDLQYELYLEAVMYFILTGETMEYNNHPAASNIFIDTLKLIKHVSSPVFRNIGSSRRNIILAVLSLRCQSLLSIKIYSLKRKERLETTMALDEYDKLHQNCGIQATQQAVLTPSSTSVPSTSSGTGGGTPSASQGTGSTANNSPLSLSLTPSPAGSVGSEGSVSSGYTTEDTRQQRGAVGQVPTPLGLTTPPQPQPFFCNPHEYYKTVVKHRSIQDSLVQAWDKWNDADEYVHGNAEIKDFFIALDHSLGPLTINSSLRELVFYVLKAFECIERLH